MLVKNSKGFDRFQEPEYPKCTCCMCGKELDVEDTYHSPDEEDDRDYCEYCYDDMFTTT